MPDYNTMTLPAARQDYLASSTTALPLGGFICWTFFTLAALFLGPDLPVYAPYIAAAAPVPIALFIDKMRGELGFWAKGRDNPISQLFMRFIFVVALLFPFVIIAAKTAADPHMLTLGVAILAGLVWVPHGWGADDSSAFIHFVARTCACYTAYLLAPEALKTAAIAGVVALAYIYAMVAMKKPASAR
jgi:hypothetical protein